jgi:hypothetical protein
MTTGKPEAYEEPSLTEFLSGQYQIEHKDVEKVVVEEEAQEVEFARPSKDDTQRSGTNKSTTMKRDDPFAPREGKTLTWRNVDMTLVSTRSSKEGSILAPAGQQ